MTGRHPPHPPHGATHVIHHVVCRHRVEVEVWPARIPVFFRDERFVNPVNTQARFEATVYNSAEGVRWQVLSPGGGSGQGSIDATGLYRAPAKAGLAHGTTDVIVAASREDPLRRAFAWVTLVGRGPLPAPSPTIEIWPKRAHLFHPDNLVSSHRNEFIDDSNKMQVFDARVRDGGDPVIEWLVDGVPQFNPAPSRIFRYQVTGSGNTRVVVVTARIKNQPAVFDRAKVVISNYRWPKMRPVAQL